MTLQYSEGIGHFVDTSHFLYNKIVSEKIINKILLAEKINKHDLACTYPHKKDLDLFTKRFNRVTCELTPPTIKDILYSLTMDSDAINYDFVDWCNNYGLDADSIEASKLYEDCNQSYRKIVALGFTLDELQKFYEDY